VTVLGRIAEALKGRGSRLDPAADRSNILRVTPIDR
jgi:hypothetical protein